MMIPGFIEVSDFYTKRPISIRVSAILSFTDNYISTDSYKYYVCESYKEIQTLISNV